MRLGVTGMIVFSCLALSAGACTGPDDSAGSGAADTGTAASSSTIFHIAVTGMT